MALRPKAFVSLRARLIASHVAVILLCLAISGGIFVYLLRGYREQLAENRLADLAYPVAIQVRALERSSVTPEGFTTFLQDQAQQLHTRYLLLDRNGVVVADSDGRLTGSSILLHVTRNLDFDKKHPGSAGWFASPGAGAYYFAARPMPTGFAPFASEARPSAFAQVVVASPRSSIVDAWRELLPSLVLAGAGSLGLTILVSLLLSRSIAGPLAQMTRATEAMARGQLNQALPIRRLDELGRLGMAFNVMATRVYASQRLLRDFVANVSHELRTPLTSVQGFAQAIADGAVQTPDEVSQSARIIIEEAERMHHLVDDLLYLSKLESGQLPIERSPLDVAGLLAVTAGRAARRAAESEITLVHQCGEVPRVLADGRRIEQVLANLLDNALRHTPIGGAITLFARSATPVPGRGAAGAAPHLVLGVQNTGSFIPPEERHRIFERFYQVDRAREHTGGSGLGLAICHEIVQAHGGEIRVESDEATGTTVLVMLEAEQPAFGKRPRGERRERRAAARRHPTPRKGPAATGRRTAESTD